MFFISRECQSFTTSPYSTLLQFLACALALCVVKNQMCLFARWLFQHVAQRSSIRAVADFKAITCPPPPKFIKCTDFEFTTSPAIALIQCWAIVLFLFRPCVGSDTLYDKLWLVRWLELLGNVCGCLVLALVSF